MRNEMHEPGQGILGAATRIDALNAPAVDEAFADETVAPIVAQRGSRRELTGAHPEADRRTIDVPHVTDALAPVDAPGDGALLRRLSQQLSSLQSQQDQIRRLLEQAEGRRATARSRRLNR